MNISPIMAIINPNYFNNKRKTQSLVNPNFKAVPNSHLIQRLLAMMNEKPLELRILESTANLGELLWDFECKQLTKNSDSCFEMLKIPEEELSKILSNQKSKFSSKDYDGYILASGAGHVSIEFWQHVYDVLIALVPKSKRK